MPAVPDTSYEQVFKTIDKRADAFITRLAEAVAIPSVSAESARRVEVVRMCKWAEKELQKLGVSTELIDPGMQETEDGPLPLPPIVFGTLGKDKSKKTVLVYGHLDVQPAQKSDGWNTDPFVLTEIDGKLFGRGSTDDKGPVLGWINAIESMQAVGVELPVNVKFVFEGMEESGSEGLEETLIKRQADFLSDVDFVCISDNYWLGKNKPCLTYGLRGICYYAVEIACAKQDLHSGSFGGSVHEAMQDLVWIMAQLADVKGNILIPGIKEQVAAVTPAEQKIYEAMDFDLKGYANDIGAHGLTRGTKEEVLMNRWRFPSLSLHGIEGAFSQKGGKTVIPAKVIGKFSIRTVPDMTIETTDAAVMKYLHELWAKRGSPNKFNPVPHHSGKSWVTDFNDPHFQSGVKAIKRVFGVEPDYTREGASIPITLVFQELTGKNVMLLPMGQSDDMAHSQNEKLARRNYIEGTKVLASYLLELGSL